MSMGVRRAINLVLWEGGGGEGQGARRSVVGFAIVFGMLVTNAALVHIPYVRYHCMPSVTFQLIHDGVGYKGRGGGGVFKKFGHCRTCQVMMSLSCLQEMCNRYNYWASVGTVKSISLSPQTPINIFEDVLRSTE